MTTAFHIPKTNLVPSDVQKDNQQKEDSARRRKAFIDNIRAESESSYAHKRFIEEQTERYSIEGFDLRQSTKTTFEDKILKVLATRFGYFYDNAAISLLEQKSDSDYVWARSWELERNNFLKDAEKFQKQWEVIKPVETESPQPATLRLGKVLVKNLNEALKTIKPYCDNFNFPFGGYNLRLIFTDGRLTLQTNPQNPASVLTVGRGWNEDDDNLDILIRFNDFSHLINLIAGFEKKDKSQLPKKLRDIGIGRKLEFQYERDSGLLIIKDAAGASRFKIVQEFKDGEFPAPQTTGSIQKKHPHYNKLKALAQRDTETRPALSVAYKAQFLGDAIYLATDTKSLAVSWELSETETAEILYFPKSDTSIKDNKCLNSLLTVLNGANTANWKAIITCNAGLLKKAIRQTVGDEINISISYVDPYNRDDQTVKLLSHSAENGDNIAEIPATIETWEYDYTLPSVKISKKHLNAALQAFKAKDEIQIRIEHHHSPVIVGQDGNFLTVIMPTNQADTEVPAEPS